MIDTVHTTGRRLKIGVVVGGGGVRTLAAGPLFSLLADNKIEPDLLVGVSGGAIMAALRGSGVPAASLPEVARRFWQPSLYGRLDYRTLLDVAGLPFGRFRKEAAMMRSERLRQVYREVFQERTLESMSPQTVLQATDLAAGQAVMLESGLATDAAYASAAQFPFMPPACIGGRLLVDGSYISALPVLEAVKRHMDVILAIGFENNQHGKPDGLFDHYWQFISKVLATGERSQTALAIALHHHETVLINVRFDQPSEAETDQGLAAIVAAGRQAVAAREGEILQAVIRG